MSTRTKSQQPAPGMSDGQLKQRALKEGAASNSVVITRSEYKRLQALINEEVTEAEKKAIANAEKQKQIEAAQARRQRMLEIDEDRRSKGVVKPIEDQKKDAQRLEDISNARMKINEEIDEVKFMNKVMQYAKCVTVRDAQVQEKRAIKMERAEGERQQDMMMEIERLKALRMYEEREQKRIEDRKRGAAVIRAQIEEREQERLRRLELKQQEQEAMLKHIDKMKDDDRAEAVKKKEAAKRLMEDVALANAEQIRLKNRQREMEQEEELQITEYLKEKERREQEIQEEQERIHNEKEREVARLRSMQERAQDKQAELDALRAKRAQEAYEREWREKERAAAARSRAINEDLARAREQQKMEKEKSLAMQAQLEKEEFERIIAVQKRDDTVEYSKRNEEAHRRQANADQLKKQIEEIEEQRRRNRRNFLEEGNKLATERKDREGLVEAIRARKLKELEGQAVPKQYRMEIMKKRNTEPLRPSK